jgi:hypothetical protein
MPYPQQTNQSRTARYHYFTSTYQITGMHISRLNLLINLFLSATAQLLVLHNQVPMEVPPKASVTQHLSLADLLGRNQKIQIFSGLIRDVDSVSQRLADESQPSIVLAPENAAMSKLPRKPWENANDYTSYGADAYSGDSGKDRANANLRRFVEQYVVPTKAWKEGEKVQSLAGNTLWLERKDGTLIVRLPLISLFLRKLTGAKIRPSGSEVLAVVDKATNGEVWIIKDAFTAE